MASILEMLEKDGSLLKSEPKPLPPLDILESVEGSQLSFPQGKVKTYLDNLPK